MVARPAGDVKESQGGGWLAVENSVSSTTSPVQAPRPRSRPRHAKATYTDVTIDKRAMDSTMTRRTYLEVVRGPNPRRAGAGAEGESSPSPRTDTPGCPGAGAEGESSPSPRTDTPGCDDQEATARGDNLLYALSDWVAFDCVKEVFSDLDEEEWCLFDIGAAGVTGEDDARKDVDIDKEVKVKVEDGFVDAGMTTTIKAVYCEDRDAIFVPKPAPIITIRQLPVLDDIPLCKYHHSGTGCWSGDACHYSHALDKPVWPAFGESTTGTTLHAWDNPHRSS